MKLPSNKKFGLTFVVLFSAFSLAAYYKGWIYLLVFSFFLSILLTVISCAFPHKLSGLNRVWGLFGDFINKLASPLILSIIFFLVITPMALIMRIFGRDYLRIKKIKHSHSYWRDKSLKKKSNFEDQF